MEVNFAWDGLIRTGIVPELESKFYRNTWKIFLSYFMRLDVSDFWPF